MTAHDAFSLANRTALVTGANTGLGQAFAIALARAGADVVAVCRKPPTETAASVAALGRRCEFIAADLGDARPADIVARALESFDAVDILVNNAGIIRRQDALELDEQDWDDVMNVNLKAAFFLSQAVARQLVERRRPGKIINVASIAAHVVLPTGAVYCATKYAVWAISDGLWQENRDIRVTTISPGVVATELGDDISDAGAKDFLRELRKDSLTPDAIARAIAYAVEQPDDVDVNEVIVRPTSSPL